MSFVFLQIGQCGNQVGCEFWCLLEQEIKKRRKKIPLHSLFHPDGYSRCIMIDTEPKVIHNVIDRYDFIRLENIRYSQPGCGNNWAVGYNFKGCCECPAKPCNEGLLEETLSAFYFEMNRCDYLKAVILIHSLGGGTGSGFGCKVIESLREKYPSMYIFSICIAPFRHGDTPLQHYNTLLSLSHIQKYADSIILFQNDDILRSLGKNFDSSGKGKRVEKSRYSTSDLNKYIASCLLNLFLPIQEQNEKWKQLDLFSIMTNLCYDERLKFLELNTSAVLSHNEQAKTSVQYIAEDLLKQVPIYDSLLNQQIHSLQALLLVRSAVYSKYDSQIVNKIIQAKICKPVPWIAASNCMNYSRFHQQEQFSNLKVIVSSSSPATVCGIRPMETTLTILANRTNVIEFLNYVLTKAYIMLESQAYVHWYARYGVDKKNLLECFDILQQVIKDYMSHLRP
jgi:hypothetical protein